MTIDAVRLQISRVTRQVGLDPEEPVLYSHRELTGYGVSVPPWVLKLSAIELEKKPNVNKAQSQSVGEMLHGQFLILWAPSHYWLRPYHRWKAMLYLK